MTKVTLADAFATLNSNKSDFVRLIETSSCDVSLYRPRPNDPQTPHRRDEIYVVAEGTGKFTCEEETETFASGDVFFVPAGAQHRFSDFSDNFSTWVIFIGPRPEN